MRAPDLDAPHVFVVQGDLGRLACDDVLVPTDSQLRVTHGFHQLLENLATRHGSYWTIDRRHVEWYHEDPALGAVRRDGAGRCWLLDTVSGEVTDLVGRVERFLRAVAHSSRGDGPARGRARRLVALPLVGTGEGGASGWRGDVIIALLARLHELVAELELDVALVLADSRDYAAAQQVRRREMSRWPLPPELVEAADQLAAQALSGGLALFVGAGVSRAAGLPVWHELLELLAGEAGLSYEERRALQVLDPPDAAEIIRCRMGEEALSERVGELFDQREHALSHALLAALPVGEAVTTNYDPLLESAYLGAGRHLQVLPDASGRPRESAEPGASWLVKLHGDAHRPETVVLTRRSFLDLADEQGALAGVVPTLLLTRHILFVGVSLLDYTFIAAAHRARRVLDRHVGHPGRRATGTVLGLREDPLRRELWQPDLDVLAVAASDAPQEWAARRLEVLLDRLAFSVSSRTGWMLDERYTGLRSAADQALADALATLANGTHPEARNSAGWPRVAELLQQLGFPAGSPDGDQGLPP